MAAKMYYEYFGLRDAPFRFLPSNTFFLSAAHVEGLAALQWAFDEPSGLTLLVGEVGTGKTMLIHALVTRLNDQRIRIAQVNNPTMSFEEMLGVIVDQIQIHPVGKGKLAALQALKTFVSDPESTDRVILIFDEAQGLSDETLEELRLLSNSRPPQRHALQIILVGQPELAQRLTDPKLRALNQRIGARALLRPLRGQEIPDYVNCLLRAQGAYQEVFSAPAMDRVARLSGGLPRKINNLCHNSLFLAYSERSSVVQPRHVQVAGAELEDLLEASRAQDIRGIRGWRGGIYRLLEKGKPLMAGGLLALAVVAGALVLKFGTGRPNQRLAHAVPNTDGARKMGEFSQPPLASRDGDEEARIQPDAAAPGLSGQNSSPADTGPTPAPVAPPSRPVAQAPPAVAPQPQPQATTGGFIVRGTIPHPDLRQPQPSANSAAVRPAVQAPASPRLTYAQQRRLQYETRRARLSFASGRYRNVIYHAKRALLLDPGNTELRDLLTRAQAVPANPKNASINREPEPSTDESVPPAEEAANAPAMPPQAASGPKVSKAVRYEISEGDAYMRAGKYDLALRKFMIAAVLDPGNANLTQRIARARGAKAMMDGTNDDSAAGTSSFNPGGVP
ncbi:MAG TPA: AAA family ATPase [Candidatus Binataceae bacterium]